MSTARFFYLSLLLAVAQALAAFLVQHFWLPQISFVAMLVALSVTFLTTSAAYAINAPNLKKGNTNFIAAMVLGMGGKMILGLISIVIVVLQFNEVLKEYVVVYILSYFIFTGFEVYSLMRKLRA